MIYDTHTHVFPDKIAEKGAKNVGDYYNLTMECDGKVSTLLSIMPENMKCIIFSASLKEESVSIGNDFILDEAQKNSCFIPFSSFYPYMSVLDAGRELERVKQKGSKGIKLHPDFQKFYIDDPHVIEIYKICAELKLPITCHMGDPNTDYSTPIRLRHVMEKIPDLKVVAAHLGGYSTWDDAEKYLADIENVYTDTSSSVQFLPPERSMRLIYAFGVDKVLFGSDYPLSSPKSAMKYIEKLPLSDEEKQKIYTENAKKIFEL